MQTIKSLQELKKLTAELPIVVREKYGMLGILKRVRYFEVSDTWEIVELYNGLKYSYTTEDLILNTNLFRSILTKMLFVDKVMQ